VGVLSVIKCGGGGIVPLRLGVVNAVERGCREARREVPCTSHPTPYTPPTIAYRRVIWIQIAYRRVIWIVHMWVIREIALQPAEWVGGGG